MLTARRILLHQPERLAIYRLYHEALSYTERALSIEPRRNLEILVAVGENLPFRDNSFDFVNCANVMDMAAQPALLFEENLRVPRRGGRFLLTDPCLCIPERAPIENWFGIETGKTTAEAVREKLKQTCDLVENKKEVLWLLRMYDRYFQLWPNDCILAQKR